MKTIRVGLIGSQFVSSIHCEALRSVPGAEVVAVTSATEAHAKAFAERHGIGRWFTDFRKMYEMADLDLVVLGLPNDLHCEATVTAAAAGKHVVLSGWIRTEDLRGGYAGLWWRVDGADNSRLAFDNMAGRGPSGDMSNSASSQDCPNGSRFTRAARATPRVVTVDGWSLDLEER